MGLLARRWADLSQSWRNADISVLSGEERAEHRTILYSRGSTDRFKHTCSIHQITSRQRTSVRQTSSQSSAWNNWNIIDVAEQMFYPHDPLYSQSTHSYSLNAFMQDSKPQQNLSVCHWTNYRYSINHERPFSLCSYYSPVCVLLPACGSNTQMFNWFTSAWESVISYLCLIRKTLCATLLPCLFPSIVFPSPSLPCYLSAFCLEQHLLHGKKKNSRVSLSRLLCEGRVKTAQDRCLGFAPWLLPVAFLRGERLCKMQETLHGSRFWDGVVCVCVCNACVGSA